MDTTIQEVDIENVIACPDCDLLYSHIHVPPGSILSCKRCGHTLHAPQKDSINKTLAYSLTGLILFVPANFLPIMSLNILGTKGSGSIYSSVMAFFDSGYSFVAVMVLLTGMLFPFIKLTILFTVSLCLKMKSYPENLPLLMRWYRHLDEWGMLEVFMVGILISIIKLHHMAHIHYDLGFFCFTGLMVVALSSSTAMDEHLFWERIETKESGH